VSREVGSLSDIGPLDSASESFTHLAAWYVQQNLDGDRLVARLGKSDANDGFVDSALTGRYLNGDFDPPANIPMPTYPTPAFGLVVFADPAEWLTIAAAAYGADLGIHEEGGAGLFAGRVFSISELTLHTSPLGLPGHYSAGAWLRTVETPDPRDPTGTASSPRNYGAYAVFDQRLFAPDVAHPERGLGAWFQVSWAPSDRNSNDLWVGGGLVYTGLVPGRPTDDLGFGASSAELSVSPSGRRDPPPEIVLEWFYAIALARWLTLEPDLQVVLDPATSGRDAVVVGARLSIGL
jgi:porin